MDDYLSAVNGISVEQLKHEEIVTLLKNTGSQVTIQVKYPLPNKGRFRLTNNCANCMYIQIDVGLLY